MGKTICPRHERAYEIGGQCDYCEPEKPKLTFNGSSTVLTVEQSTMTMPKDPPPYGSSTSKIFAAVILPAWKKEWSFTTPKNKADWIILPDARRPSGVPNLQTYIVDNPANKTLIVTTGVAGQRILLQDEGWHKTVKTTTRRAELRADIAFLVENHHFFIWRWKDVPPLNEQRVEGFMRQFRDRLRQAPRLPESATDSLMEKHKRQLTLFRWDYFIESPYYYRAHLFRDTCEHFGLTSKKQLEDWLNGK
jgi:hypothetical protein